MVVKICVMMGVLGGLVLIACIVLYLWSERNGKKSV